MTYDEIVDMWAKDSVINGEALDSESLRIPLTQGKYFNLFCREKAALIILTTELKKLKLWKREYYLGEIPPEELVAKGIPVIARVIIKSEIDMYLDTDADVIKLLGKIGSVQLRIDFLNLCLKSLSSRYWNIKSAIDFLKLKNGII